MSRSTHVLPVLALAAAVLGAGASCSTEPKVTASSKEVTLLNVSYDPTRELYTAVNAAFVDEATKAARAGESGSLFNASTDAWAFLAKTPLIYSYYSDQGRRDYEKTGDSRA